MLSGSARRSRQASGLRTFRVLHAVGQISAVRLLVPYSEVCPWRPLPVTSLGDMQLVDYRPQPFSTGVSVAVLHNALVAVVSTSSAEDTSRHGRRQVSWVGMIMTRVLRHRAYIGCRRNAMVAQVALSSFIGEDTGSALWYVGTRLS